MNAMERRRAARWTSALVALLAASWPGPGAEADVASSTSYVLSQATQGGAGTTSTSTDFILDGTMSQEATVGESTSATFLLQSGFWTSASTNVTFKVLASGSGSGTVTGQGIACDATAGAVSGDCDETLIHGQSISVVAAPDAANSFDGWTGCDSTSTTSLPGDTCEVLLTDDREVTVAFTALGSLGDLVWRDVDGDGIQGGGEPGIDGVTVNLTGGPTGPLSTVTGGGGFYGFADLTPGTYTVSIDTTTLPPGVVPSYDLDGTGTPHTAQVPIADGQNRVDVDFGYQPLVDLQITKEDSEDPLPGGNNLVYTITVDNLGPAPATNVVVTDVLPAGTTLVATSGCAEDPNGTPTCSLGDLGIGATTSFTIEVSIDPAPPGSITNTATVAATETDPAPGNNSDSETTTLDDSSPQVVLVDSDETTDDGEVTDCETIHGQQVSRLFVRFDEDMLDPGGDGSGGDVTNPESWLLVQAGPDAELTTTDCGGPDGDDVQVAISEISYDDATTTATLDLGGALEGDLYRLFACGTGGSYLRDLAGNPLDGDGNGTGGDDFLRYFRADPANQLANGHFDCDLGSWVEVSTNPSEIFHSDEDVEDSADSGSAAVENLTASTDFAIGQCVDAAPERNYTLQGRVRMTTSAAGIGVRFSCTYYSAVGCSGTNLGTPATQTTFLGETGTTWVSLGGQVTSPSGTASGLCAVDFVTNSGASFEARVDRMELLGGIEIFSDGFESGDTSAWSATVTP